MKDNLLDVHRHLVEAMEELREAKTMPALDMAVTRGQTMAKLALAVVRNGDLMLNAAQFQHEVTKAGNSGNERLIPQHLLPKVDTVPALGQAKPTEGGQG